MALTYPHEPDVDYDLVIDDYDLVIDDHMFTIKASNGVIAYADDEHGAYAAYWQLHRDYCNLPTTVIIINNITEKFVWGDK